MLKTRNEFFSDYTNSDSILRVYLAVCMYIFKHMYINCFFNLLNICTFVRVLQIYFEKRLFVKVQTCYSYNLNYVQIVL